MTGTTISAKDRYRLWCSRESGIPVFSRDWWLDAVCGEQNWDVVLIEEGNAISAAMPFFMKKRGIFKLLTMPPLTQTMGPYVKEDAALSHSAKLSREKKIFTEMIGRLPKCDYYHIKFNWRYTNWLPFFWAGFKQTTGYTYIISGLSDLDRVFSEFSSSKKRNIRKAEKIVEIGYDLTAREFYENHAATLKKRGKEITYSYDLFERIYSAAYHHSAGRVIYARDRKGYLHAAIFVIWSPEAAYDLVYTIDPEYGSSGASSLLIYEIIKYVSSFTDRFDFEGSMIEEVEESYRKFGSRQTPYFVITKTPSLLLRLREAAMLLGTR